jgi:hypothetical protein
MSYFPRYEGGRWISPSFRGGQPRACYGESMTRFVFVLIIAMTLVSPALAADRYLVGVYYFAGWWREHPNKYFEESRDWRLNYPDRRATLGAYNEQATMDREIDAASGHGVSFFQIRWYWQGNPTAREAHQEKLNAGVEQFMRSPNASKMKFTIEYVNHPPFGITRDGDWEKACRRWCDVMKHPSYLRIDGRAVFKIHGLDYFVRQMGGIDRAAEHVKALRRIARESGAGDLLVSAGITSGPVPSAKKAAPFDFLTTYMDVPSLPPRQTPYPYEALLKLATDLWANCAANSPKPYVPYLPAGWDPRPWHDPRPSFQMPTRAQWLDALRSARRAMDQHERLSIPTRDGRVKMLLIYAWNEFGEGGIVAPTTGRGDMMLEGISQVFGPAQAGR